MSTRKYYALIPATFSHDGKFYWQELREVTTLTAAEIYVERIFGGLLHAEIGVSVDGALPRVIAKRNTEGKWEVICEDVPKK